MGLVASLDLGSEKIAMSLASVEVGNDPMLLSIKIAPSRGFEGGVIVDRDLLMKSLKTMLGELLKNKSVDTIQVAVGGGNLLTRKREVVVNLPKKFVEDRDLSHADQLCDESVDYQDEELIDKLVCSYELDGRLTNSEPLGEMGRVLKVLYQQYIVRKSYTQQLRQLLGDLGFVHINFVAQTRAYYEALYPELQKKNIAIVDLGCDSIKTVIFTKSLLHTDATLPLGTSTIDSDIAGAFRIELPKARTLKHTDGNALRSLCKNRKVQIPETKHVIDSKDLSTVVQSRMEELLTGVSYIIQRSRIQESLDAVYLTGGGCRLCNVDSLLNRMLDVNVTRAMVHEVSSSKEDFVKTPEFFTALGLLKTYSPYVEQEEGLVSRIFKKFWN